MLADEEFYIENNSTSILVLIVDKPQVAEAGYRTTEIPLQNYS